MSDTNEEDFTAEFVQALKDMNGRELRTLKWKVKQLGKQIGKASATIYQLRCENAALREAVTWNPGDRARLYNEVRELSVENRKLRQILNDHADVILAQPPRLVSREETITGITVEKVEAL